MHPINSRNFGRNGITVNFYDGFRTDSGWIVKQHSQNTFQVTNGFFTETLKLAPTTAIASNLTANPGYFTIILYPPNHTASGATITPHYEVAGVAIPPTIPGQGYVAGDVLTFTGSGGATITVITTSGGNNTIDAFSVSSNGTGVTSLPANPVATTVVGGASFTGSISGSILTASAVTGTIAAGQSLTGSSVDLGTIVSSFGSGTGGAGTYNINGSQTLSSEAMTSKGFGCSSDLVWFLSSVTGSGGNGYQAGNGLIFNGLAFYGIETQEDSSPQAFVSTVSGGAVSTFTVLTDGDQIVGAPTSISVSAPVEYVCRLSSNSVATTAGNSYAWSLGTTLGSSAIIPRFLAQS